MAEWFLFSQCGEGIDVDSLDREQLFAFLHEIQEKIARLDQEEPDDMASEEYELWADQHEVWEDLLDEVRDRLDELNG